MKKNPEDEFIQIQDLLKMPLVKWPWFICSLFICLSIALLYIAVTPPVYTRSASILIKDNSKGGMSSESVTSFSDMGLFRSNTNINNEILTLKSPLLMQDVVRRLKLDENYSVKGFFRDQILYKESPVIVFYDSLKTEGPFSFNIELLPKNRIRLSDFVFAGTEMDKSIVKVGNLSDSIPTPWGTIAVFPSSSYSKDYLHQTLLFSRSSLSSVVDHYINALNVALNNEQSTIVSLSIDDVSTQRAEDVLNTLITIYNENWVKDKNQVAISTSLFISERLNVIENELGNVDDNISLFKSQNLMPDVQAASSLYMAQSTENRSRILDLNTQHSVAGYVLAYLRDPATKDQLLPANLGIESSKVGGQISEYNTLLLRRNTMMANSSDKNPLVLDLNQSLESMRTAVIHSVENLLVTLTTQIKDVQKSEKQTSERIASNPEQAKYLLSIERQQKVKEALYLYLLQKREENQLSQAFTAYNTKLITPPSGSMFPTAPKRMSILMIGFVIGLLLPMIVLFLMEIWNTKVRGRKDLSVLSIPFVGEIPQIMVSKKKQFLKGKKNRRDRDDIVVADGQQDYMNEAFRVARTNLDFLISTNDSDHRKVLMFTSLHMESGKTFTSLNMAISMAIKGQKVVIVDLDMRKASLSIYIDSPATGVSNYLGKMINNIDEIINKTQIHANLDIIPVGTIPPNPAELLLDDRFVELLDQLKEKYDYIFLDCPPVGIVTDASIIGRVADLTVFVIRAGLMDRQSLPEVEELYQKKHLNSMSVLLNGTNSFQGRYGYRRYGY